MEPANSQKVQPQHDLSFSQLTKVTQLSKYLALGLLITLPFIGGLVGYTYAPEKLVDIENVAPNINGLSDALNDVSTNASATWITFSKFIDSDSKSASEGGMLSRTKYGYAIELPVIENPSSEDTLFNSIDEETPLSMYIADNAIYVNKKRSDAHAPQASIVLHTIANDTKDYTVKEDCLMCKAYYPEVNAKGVRYYRYGEIRSGENEIYIFPNIDQKNTSLEILIQRHAAFTDDEIIRIINSVEFLRHESFESGD